MAGDPTTDLTRPCETTKSRALLYVLTVKLVRGEREKGREREESKSESRSRESEQRIQATKDRKATTTITTRLGSSLLLLPFLGPAASLQHHYHYTTKNLQTDS